MRNLWFLFFVFSYRDKNFYHRRKNYYDNNKTIPRLEFFNYLNNFILSEEKIIITIINDDARFNFFLISVRNFYYHDNKNSTIVEISILRNFYYNNNLYFYHDDNLSLW